MTAVLLTGVGKRHDIVSAFAPGGKPGDWDATLWRFGRTGILVRRDESRAAERRRLLAVLLRIDPPQRLDLVVEGVPLLTSCWVSLPVNAGLGVAQ